MKSGENEQQKIAGSDAIETKEDLKDGSPRQPMPWDEPEDDPFLVSEDPLPVEVDVPDGCRSKVKIFCENPKSSRLALAFHSFFGFAIVLCIVCFCTETLDLSGKKL